jgi:NAD+ kinase
MSQPSVGIIYKHHFEPAKQKAESLSRWFEQRGIRAFCEEMKATETLGDCEEESVVVKKRVSWTVVLGGDGTLLGAARKVGRSGVPILGVNLGGLGFLTGVPQERLYPVLEMMLESRLEIENRMMLATRVLRKGTEACRFHVLNDVVINKGALARIIDLDVSINGEFLTTFRADGLIISTPTGSTAYNLSAGGPILYPTMESFTLTPICPFTLTNRPIILPDSSVMEIRMGKESEERVILTFDGQVGFDLEYEDRVLIHKSEIKIALFRPPDHSYFRILRTKLMWGGVTFNKNSDH